MRFIARESHFVISGKFLDIYVENTKANLHGMHDDKAHPR